MSVTIQLDLPEEIVREARRLGLLDTNRMTALLAEEVRRRRAGQDFQKLLDQVRDAPGEAATIEDVNAEVKIARKERRAREAGG